MCVLEQKNSRERTNNTFLKLFLNAMIKNITIDNIPNIIEFQNIWNLINSLIKKNYENIYLSIFYDFSKCNGSMKIKV
jgi:hypothetical protein